MPIFILQLCAYLIAGNAKCSGVTTPPRPPICVWNKPNLVANALLCSDFSQYVIFFPSLFNARFFTSGIGSDNLLNVFKDWIIFFIWVAWVLLNFYLKQKQIFSLECYWEYTFISFHRGIWVFTEYVQHQVLYKIQQL